ncbi:MAG TPA: hypothetical protein VEY07_06555, partial [Thermoplasmata archaeon]|nr:hypothetical protein [Thermoplasmata archaeon]
MAPNLDLAAARPTAEEPIARLRRRLLTHRDRLAGLLESLSLGHADPEQLHEWHRELKRLRV